MKKETNVKAHTRRTKSGKTVTVKAHTQKYDAAEEAQKALKKKKGAGSELDSMRNNYGMNDFYSMLDDVVKHGENFEGEKFNNTLKKEFGKNADFAKMVFDIYSGYECYPYSRKGLQKLENALRRNGVPKIKRDTKTDRARAHAKAYLFVDKIIGANYKISGEDDD